jgi:raffinose/stachyose/melibiose transport system permease protein
MVMFVSSMQSIPQELFEAVRVDGAGPVREFFTITLPNLRGPLSVVLALTMIGAIRLFDLVWLTTKGGPGTSTITPTVVLYERAFANPQVGSAAAIGVVMTLVSLLVVLVIVKVAEGRSE